MTERDDEQTRIGEQAAEWAVRLAGGPLGEGERRDFERWRSQSPGHADALRHARGVWDDLAGLGLAGLGAARRRAAGRVTGWAVAAGLLLAVGLGGGWAGGLDLMLLADHRTAAAELRSVTLPDGSVAELGPASAIAVRFGEGERRVALLSGAAYFTVAPVPEPNRRPFLVETANGTARALGTRFAVNRLGDAVEVAVAEHAVRVEVVFATGASATGAGDSVTVEAGQSVRYDRRGGLGPVAAADVAQATAWRRGRLVFDRVPLGSVVDSLNRYRRDRIVVADSALAGREVSGMFDAARLDEALLAIAREMNARILAVPPLLTVLY